MARDEENTKFKHIHPKLAASGWSQYEWQIDMEYAITAGRIQWDGKTSRRAKPQYADYLLRYKSSVAIAVVEAKSNKKHHLEDLEQAKTYAKKLGLWFAYTTKGYEIEFIDLKACRQSMKAMLDRELAQMSQMYRIKKWQPTLSPLQLEGLAIQAIKSPFGFRGVRGQIHEALFRQAHRVVREGGA
jgi:type I site-specific restriction endonuclease